MEHAVIDEIPRRRTGPEEKKSRVLREARRLFVQCGYHNVSMPDIVKAAGVSTGAIYSYFPNKEALAREIHERVRIPSQSFQRFRRKLSTDSEPNFPRIPRQAFQRFRRKLSSLPWCMSAVLTSQ